MSLLTTVQHFCRRMNVPVPSTVSGTTDRQIRQVSALLEEEGADLSKRGAWQALTFEATHTSLAAESQGALTTIATAKFDYVKDETMWDRTDQLPILGPLNERDWQALKANTSTGTRYRYRIRNGELLVYPTMEAGHTVAFEYISKYWILNGSTYKEFFDDDDDTILLPEAVVLMGLRWRWKKEKGLDYAEDFRMYEDNVAKAFGRDKSSKTLLLDQRGPREPRPGIFVPTGPWPL